MYDREIVRFGIGNQCFGIYIEHIEQIVKGKIELTRLAHKYSDVHGIMRWYGNNVIVVGINKYINQPDYQKEDEFTVICRTARRRFAFVVENVFAISRIKNSDIIDIGDSIWDKELFICGYYKQGCQIVPLLDLEQIAGEIDIPKIYQ